MKTVEVIFDNSEFEELNMKDSPITLRDLEIRLSKARARKAFHEANRIAREEGLDKMSDEEINDMIKEVRKSYDKNNS